MHHLTHAQAAAPGYAEYYLWCIRLQDDKNIDTIFVPEYLWVTAPDAKYSHKDAKIAEFSPP